MSQPSRHTCKQPTCHQEPAPCGDSACQKGRLRDAFLPHRPFLQSRFVPSFRLGVSVSSPFSSPDLSNEPCLPAIFIRTTSPIFHSYVEVDSLRDGCGVQREQIIPGTMSPGKRRLKKCVRPRSSYKDINSLCVNVFMLQSGAGCHLFLLGDDATICGSRWSLEHVAWHFGHLFLAHFLRSTTATNASKFDLFLPPSPCTHMEARAAQLGALLQHFPCYCLLKGSGNRKQEGKRKKKGGGTLKTMGDLECCKRVGKGKASVALQQGWETQGIITAAQGCIEELGAQGCSCGAAVPCWAGKTLTQPSTGPEQGSDPRWWDKAHRSQAEGIGMGKGEPARVVSAWGEGAL